MDNNPVSLNERIAKMIEDEYDVRIQKFCNDDCPLKIILRSALTNHFSPQCKVRAVIEGCYSWYKVSKDRLYLELAQKLIDYANSVYINKSEIENFSKLVNSWWDYSAMEFPYLSIELKDRIKALISEMNDIISKTIRFFIAEDFIIRASELFGEEDATEAIKVLKKLKDSFKNARNKDIFGVMFILDYADRKTDDDDPEFLAETTLKFANGHYVFMQSQGNKILTKKDYISKPKSNDYRAYHMVVKGTTEILEIQYRSQSMHDFNEDPNSTAAHRQYKYNQTLFKFLNKLVDDIVGPVTIVNPQNFEEEKEKKKMDKLRYGITKEMRMFSPEYRIRTSNDEIPSSLKKLHHFEGLEELKKLYIKHT